MGDNRAFMKLVAATRERVERHERLHQLTSVMTYYDARSGKHVVKDEEGNEVWFDTQEEQTAYLRELWDKPLSLVTTRKEIVDIMATPTGQVTLAEPLKPGEKIRITYDYPEDLSDKIREKQERRLEAERKRYPEVKPKELPPPSPPRLVGCHPVDVAENWAERSGYELVLFSELGGTDESYALYRHPKDGHGYVTVQHGNEMSEMDGAHWRAAQKVLGFPEGWASGDYVPTRIDGYPRWVRIVSYGVAYMWVLPTWPFRWLWRNLTRCP